MRSPGPAEGDCFAVWKQGGSLSPAPRAAWALLAVTLETAAGGASGRPPQPGLALDSCLGRGRKSAGLGDGRDASASDLTAALSVRVGRCRRLATPGQCASRPSELLCRRKGRRVDSIQTTEAGAPYLLPVTSLKGPAPRRGRREPPLSREPRPLGGQWPLPSAGSR